MYQNSRKFGMPKRLYLKLLLTMRLTIVLLIACFMQVSASSLAQKVTLFKSNATLKSVFKDLKEQTGYNFFYTENLLSSASKITLDVNNMPIENVLELIFKSQNLSYSIEDKTVIIR